MWRYGLDGLFPVVDTPLGRIAMMVCYDICFPEVARSLAMRGAEIILHPTGEPYGAHRSVWRQAKHTRAFENRVYLISANHASYYCQTDDGAWTDGDGLQFHQRQRRPIAPSMRSHGKSEIIDFNGSVVAEIDGPGEATITGTIDIEALRHARSQRAFNFLAQHMPQVYAPLYAATELRPTDGWADAPIAQRAEARQFLLDRIDQLHDNGMMLRSIYDDL